ncbi:DUF6173 family protein [Litoreibacter janthinus]|uniref:Uncharacterized protein n=1 Tax=Litoreibacter janthinus TaxID=670154 RepID=A0A1I6G5V3_9RHOB|nr:DUF6173 family protein [Litoreibacter janthinus]SFR37583.1 hypothetical protein SAMN04488002_0947 [Litoreibacter janthinus]
MDNKIETTAEAIEANALRRAGVVHVGNCGPTPEQQPLPDAMSKTPIEQKSPAEWAYERLILYIKNFEEQLDNNHEIAMGFVGGDAGVMRIEGIGFYAPDVITFYGADPAGARTQQIQHVSQLNVQLRALPKNVDQPEPNRIGFRLAQDLGTA